MPVRIERSGGRVSIIAGQHRFALEADDPTLPARHPTVDFALYGLAGLSMSAGLSLRLDAPVSPSAAEMLENLRRAFGLLCLPRLAPLRIDLPQVTQAVPPACGDRGLLCLSGRIDSTFAAVRARADGITHGLLIAGADYPDAD